MKDEVMRPA